MREPTNRERRDRYWDAVERVRTACASNQRGAWTACRPEPQAPCRAPYSDSNVKERPCSRPAKVVGAKLQNSCPATSRRAAQELPFSVMFVKTQFAKMFCESSSIIPT